MIPLSMRQKSVTITDDDGITWTFAVNAKLESNGPQTSYLR